METNLKRSLAFLAMVGGVAFSASAQISATEPISISTGNNLIGNPLTTGSVSTDTLNNVLTDGVMDGSTFAPFNTATQSLMTPSVYTLATTSWSINYTFTPNGVGGVLNSPDPATVILAGQVINVNFTTGAYTFVPPGYGPGTFLLSLAAALGPSSGDGTFAQVTGRTPSAGDEVELINNGVQTTTTFNGSSWNNGTPMLNVGEAGYYVLSVPEPTTFALFGLGAGLLAFARRFRS